MKYWLFEAGDVVGPFSARQLAARDGFGPGSLVCPEDRAGDSASWKPASGYGDFSFSGGEIFLPETGELPSVAAEVIEQEMLDTLSRAKGALASPDELEPAPARHDALQMPAKRPSKPSPIEDYFNNIKGEDLGNILGIPDPNENSDMNLQRALETQFSADTTPPAQAASRPEAAPDPFDEFSAAANELEDVFIPSKKAVAPQPSLSVSAAEPQPSAERSRRQEDLNTVFGPEPQPSPEKNPQAVVRSREEISIQTPAPAPAAGSASENAPAETPSQPEEAPVSSAPVTEKSVAAAEISDKKEPASANEPSSPVLQAEEPKRILLTEDSSRTVSDEVVPLGGGLLPMVPADGALAAGNLSLEPEIFAAEPPSAEETPQPQKAEQESISAEEETDLMPEEIRIKPRLEQTPQMEKIVTARMNRSRRRVQFKALVWAAVAFVLVILSGVVYFNRRASVAFAPSAARSVQPTEKTAALPPRNALAQTETEETVLSAEDRARAAVENFYLPQMGVTIGQYFDNIYKDKRAEGYATDWSVDPLHKTVYVVKYRVTKTRKEPVVYIFQADASDGRLLGALNNAALDLVGKLK